MSPFLLAAKVKDLYHQYSSASQQTKEIIRQFYRRVDDSGCVPLGIQGQDYHWVTLHAGKFPAGQTQQDYIAANTPVGYAIRIHQI